MKSRPTPFIVTAWCLLMVSGCSTMQSQEKPKADPQVVAQCKAELPNLSEAATMGELLTWAVNAAGRFNKCRAAALGE